MSDASPTTDISLHRRLHEPTRVDGSSTYWSQREKDWRRFVELYQPVVYRLARKKDLSRDDAEDLAQAVMIKMRRELKRLELDPSRGRFRNWLCTVALNEIYKFYRGKNGKPAIVPIDDAHGAVQSDAATEEFFRTGERIRVLQIALVQLQEESDPRPFETFRLLALEQRSGDEVAKMFAMTRNQVYGIKFRMLSRLRELAREIEAELGMD